MKKGVILIHDEFSMLASVVYKQKSRYFARGVFSTPDRFFVFGASALTGFLWFPAGRTHFFCFSSASLFFHHDFGADTDVLGKDVKNLAITQLVTVKYFADSRVDFFLGPSDPFIPGVLFFT